MMSDTKLALPADAQPYLAAVRELLWALPTDERDELLDDLSAHLAELAAEEGPSLRERLGVPSAYAAEFVTSAGVEPPPARRLVTFPSVHVPPSVHARWVELRPAWRALRPFLIVFGGAASLNEGHVFGNVGSLEIVVLALIALAFIGPSQRLAGFWDRAATVAGVVAALVVIAALGQGRQYVYVDNTGGYGPTGALTRGDGTSVSNIWAYDRDGNPIDVFLFDQDGRPIDDVIESGWDPRTGDEVRSPLRTDASGAAVPNLYPREQTRLSYDHAGRPVEREVRPPAYSTPRLEPERTTTSTTTTPSTTVTTVPAGPPSTP